MKLFRRSGAMILALALSLAGGMAAACSPLPEAPAAYPMAQMVDQHAVGAVDQALAVAAKSTHDTMTSQTVASQGAVLMQFDGATVDRPAIGAVQVGLETMSDRGGPLLLQVAAREKATKAEKGAKPARAKAPRAKKAKPARFDGDPAGMAQLLIV